MSLPSDSMSSVMVVVACMFVLTLIAGTDGSGYGLIPPPEFILRAPPKPYDLEDLQYECPTERKGKNGPQQSTDEGRVPVGMILGMIISGVVVLGVVLVAWMMARRKSQQYQKEPEADKDKPQGELYHHNIRRWFWRKRADKQHGFGSTSSSRCRRKQPDHADHAQDSLSNTSSESGYCEETLEHPDHHPDPASRGRAAVRRGRRQDVSQPSGEVTPDIIASVQTGEDATTPTRWSLFGLLPSLKPVLSLRGLDVDSPIRGLDVDSPESPEAEESQHLSTGMTPSTSELSAERQSTSRGISLSLLSPPAWLRGAKKSHKQQDPDDGSGLTAASAAQQDSAMTDTQSNVIRQKKSRLHLKLNLRKQKPEVSV